MIGIKGVGMAALAVMYKQMGYQVKGSDVDEYFPTDELLRKHNIEVRTGFDPKNVDDDFDFAVTTGAHGGLKNVESRRIKKLKIKLFTHAQALGEIMKKFKIKIAVCGTHGKTTTSAIIAHLLSSSNLSGAHHIGVPFFAGHDGGYFCGFDYIVVEADEYVSSVGVDDVARFSYLEPNIIVATNIQYDHPDVYRNINEVRQSFNSFFKKLVSQKNSRFVYCIDDPWLFKSAGSVPAGNQISCGFVRSADYYIKSYHCYKDRSDFVLSFKEENTDKKFTIGLTGKHNVSNAALSICLAKLVKINPDILTSSLKSFDGLSRRFQKIFEKNNILLFDDYAHHPAELDALIEQVRSAYPKHRILILHQPHTYSRLQKFQIQFADSLSKADLAFILPVFGSAREKKSENVDSQYLVNLANKKGYNNLKFTTEENLYEQLEKHISPNDVIITAGAGDLYKHHRNLIKIISNK